MSNKQKICEHCGETLPADYPYVYCRAGLEEFRDRRAFIEADPFVTIIVYGEFIDPETGENCIVVQYRKDVKRVTQKAIIAAIKNFLKPMFNSKRSGEQRFYFDQEPSPYVGTMRLWEASSFTRLKWDGTRLKKMLRRVS